VIDSLGIRRRKEESRDKRREEWAIEEGGE
jgi:hypothetical protein